MKPCVIFDMDGTLVDSSHGMTRSVNYVRKALGLDPIDVSMLTYYINTPGENLPKRFYGTEEYNPAHRELFKEHYIENCGKELQLYDGIKEVLDDLSSKANLAVATNASDFFAKKMLVSTGIDQHFKLVVGANTLGISKPDPAMLLHITKEMGANNDQTLLVGDSQKDEMAALNAKMKFIYVTWGYGEYSAPTSLKCALPQSLGEMVSQELNL